MIKGDSNRVLWRILRGAHLLTHRKDKTQFLAMFPSLYASLLEYWPLLRNEHIGTLSYDPWLPLPVSLKRCPAGSVGCRYLLPNNCAHIVKANGFTEFDNLSPDGNYLVPSIINRACKLISDVYAKAASGM